MRLKNYAPILVFTFFYSTAFSQTQKGSFVLSGKTDLNFLFANTIMATDSIETGRSKTNQFGFTAAAGYFIADDLTIGISGTFSYNYTKNNISSYCEMITWSATVMPQVNYYLPAEGKLRPSVGAGVGYLWLRERDSRVSANSNTVYYMSGVAYSAGAGLSYFITPHVAFDLNFQYSHSRLKDEWYKDLIQKQNGLAGTLGVSVFL